MYGFSGHSSNGWRKGTGIFSARQGVLRMLPPHNATDGEEKSYRFLPVHKDRWIHHLLWAGVREAKVEGVFYESLSKQTQVILELDNIFKAGQLDTWFVKQGKYSNRMEEYLDRKRVRHEQLVLKRSARKTIKRKSLLSTANLTGYGESTPIWKHRSRRCKWTKGKERRTELMWEVVGIGGLTAELADTLIDRTEYMSI